MIRSCLLLLLIVIFGSCGNNTPNKSKELKKAIAMLEKSRSYKQYLNEIITFQKRFPEKKKSEISFDVKFNVIRPLENTPLSDEDFQPLVNFVNAAFLESKIQFKLQKGVNYIFDESPVDLFYYNGNIENSITKSTYDPSVLNIYVVESLDQVVGFTHYPIENNQRLFIAREKLFDPSLIHEIGHYFGLLHTFDENESIPAEKILSTVNCEKEGDKICDTPTDVPGGASFIEKDCTIYGVYKDENGNIYKPDLSNFMSYYGACRSKFSPQQLNRMYFIAKNIKAYQLK